jgi:hypothetical protein
MRWSGVAETRDQFAETSKRGLPGDALLTYKQAGEYLRLSYSRIADLVYKGILHPAPPPPNYPNRKLKLLRRSDLDWYNTQRPQPNPEATLVDLGIAPGNMGMLSYEQAAHALEISVSDVAALVSAGELHQDANNRLRSDEISWYDRKRRGEDPGENPVEQTEQTLAQREADPLLEQDEPPSSQPFDTWVELRRYAAEHMGGSAESDQLDMLLGKVAGHLATTLATSKQLPADERARLWTLLAALTQTGGDTRS